MGETKDLVQQGLTAARVGELEEARRLLAEATRRTPENVEAWLGLAGVVTSLQEKKEYFSKALDLDPDNIEAREGLARVEQKLRAESPPSTGLGYCYRHPDVETGLRCNRCNKFICPRCAQRSPVGFRCPECVREIEDKYYSGTNLDYIIAAVIALPLSLILATLFVRILGGWGPFLLLIIGFFVAPIATGLIAEAVRWGVGKRRSRYLRHVVITCLVLGTAPFLLLSLISGSFYGLLAPGIFLFFGIATISARLR